MSPELAQPAELCAALDVRGLLDAPTLQFGWEAGWVDRDAVAAAAVRWMEAAPEFGDADADLAALAASDIDGSDDDKAAHSLALLAARSASLPAEEINRRWWLAHLDVLVQRGLAPEALVEQAERLWADLGYPPELAALSPYHDGPSPAGGQPDPVRAPAELIDVLGHSA